MMQGKSIGWAVVGLFVVGLLTSSGMAVRFRRQADALEDALARARAETDALRLRQEDAGWMSAAPVTVPVTEDLALADAEDGGLTERLESRIRELEAALSERDRQRTARVVRTEDEAGGEAGARRQRLDLESLRETDPERYNEIVERREQMRERVDQAFTRRTDFLLNQDVSDLGVEEQADHKRLVELLYETWALAERQRGEQTREESMQAWRTLRDNARELEPLMRKARDRELVSLAKSVGYTEADAAVFSDYIKDVFEITSLTGGLMPGGAGRGRRTATPRTPAAPAETPDARVR